MICIIIKNENAIMKGMTADIWTKGCGEEDARITNDDLIIM